MDCTCISTPQKCIFIQDFQKNMVISFWGCASLVPTLRKISQIWPFPLFCLWTESKKMKRWARRFSSQLSLRCVFPCLTGRSRTYTPSCLSAARPTTPRPRRLPPSATWVIRGSAVAPAARVYSVAIRFCRQVADNRLPNCGKLFTVRLSAPLLAVQALQAGSLVRHLRRKHFGFPANQKSGFSAVNTGRSLDFRPAAGWLISPSWDGPVSTYQNHPTALQDLILCTYIYIYKHWFIFTWITACTSVSSCCSIVWCDVMWWLTSGWMILLLLLLLLLKTCLKLQKEIIFCSSAIIMSILHIRVFPLCCPLLVKKCSALPLYSLYPLFRQCFFFFCFLNLYLDVPLPIYSVCLYFSMNESRFCALLFSIKWTGVCTHWKWSVIFLDMLFE